MHKQEPFFDGPFVIIAVNHQANSYSLATPNGKLLENDYNGKLLFPAYVLDKQPLRSLWYSSKRLLDLDRRRWLARFGLKP